MKTNKKELVWFGTCKEDLDRFIDQTNNTESDVEVASLVGGKNTYSDILWLLNEKGVSRERIVRFACDCALLNIELIKPYTDKYRSIIDFLNNPTNADAARAARDVVRTTRAAYASNPARAAARAVRAATRAVTHDAYVSNTVDTADFARIVYTADKVNKLLIDLINEF